MPGKKAKEPEKSPRGLLDSIENLDEDRRRKKEAKRKTADELDLHRIG